MAIKFHPMPWLTLITLICLGILLSLGTWQYQRLHWKADLLKEIDQAANAAPLSSANELANLYANEQALDFRRVGLTGVFVTPDINEGAPFHLMKSNGKTMLWHLFQPFQTEDGIVYVATRRFPHSQKAAPPPAIQGEQTVIGYVRLVREASAMQPDSNPDSNEWYVLNAVPEEMDWTAAVKGQSIPTGYFIDQIDDVETAGALPVKKPDLPNNHLEYMLTWYSFAVILLVIYLILHKRQGRLQFGTENA